MSASVEPLPLSDDRFVAQGLLGRGAFGSVHDVLDTRTGQRVALKLLDRHQGRALARFKTEFRALTDLHHPNLVRLYELHHEPAEAPGEGRWYFTMERVVGTDPLTRLAIRGGDAQPTAAGTASGAASDTGEAGEQWFASGASAADAPPSPLRPAALDQVRAVFAQIAAGIAALHGAGILHRDLKPSNILVDGEGRVKLLDFGLISLLDRDHDHRRLAGTPRYLAPELLAGGAVSPASDWYAFGVMLHQALTGRLPPGDGPGQLLAGERGNLPQLCRGLLEVDPTRRPREAEILASLELDPDQAGLPRPRVRAFVGRQAELSALMDAFERSRDAPVVAWVLGASGVGKTALVRELLTTLEHERGALVASGRCFQQQTLPLAAVDGMIDALGLALAQADIELGLDVAHADALRRLFPTLSVALGEGAPPSMDEPLELEVLRRRATAALAKLLASVAQARPLVLHIDDLQWGDAASGALLAALVEGELPALVVGTCRAAERTEAEFLAPFDALGREVERVELELGPLADSEGRRLVSALLDADEAEPELVVGIAAASEGNPFFIEELVRLRDARRRMPADLRALVRHRVSALEPQTRRLLERVAVASQPTARALVFGPQDGPGAWAALDQLRGMQLVRVRDRGRGEAQLESYHDRIREAVLADLDAEAKRAHHRSLAEAMSAAGFQDRGRIAQHYVGAGEGERAVPHALAGAEAARVSLAFERAIALYELALGQLDPASTEARGVQEQRAEVSVFAGRLTEAAEIYEALAPGHARPDEMLRRASEHYLTAGQVERGVALLREQSERHGLRWPASEGRALLGVLARVVRMRARGLSFDDAASPDPAKLATVDLCYAAGRGLSSLDFARAAHYQMIGLEQSLGAGDRERALLQLSFASASLRGMGLRMGELARAEAARLLDESCLGSESFVAAHLLQNDGFVAILSGRYAEALATFERSVAMFEAVRDRSTVWELSLGRAMREDCLYMLGDYAALGRLAPESKARAEALGDRMSAFTAGLYYGALQLARGRPERARSILVEVVEGLSATFPHGWPHTMAIAMQLACELYVGDFAGAWRRFELEWPRFRRSPFYRTKGTRARVGSSFAHLIWRLLDADAAGVPSREVLLGHGRRLTKLIRGTGIPWALADADYGEAMLALWAKGDWARARARLGAATRGYRAQGMVLRASEAEARLAHLAEDEVGLRAGLAAIADCGVAEPERWLGLRG